MFYCIADQTPKAKKFYNQICKKYSHLIVQNISNLNEDGVIVVIGGDGFMIHTLHNYIGKKYRFYGINSGTVGFLMNPFNLKSFENTLSSAEHIDLYLLELEAKTARGKKSSALAINEISIFRELNQAANIKISINSSVKLEKMVGDGIIISTPAGSSAYNYSAGGPIIPLNSNLLAMTPINANFPKRWKGALVKDDFIIEIENLDVKKRPVSATADFLEFRDIKYVKIKKSKFNLALMFDKGNKLDDKIFDEQFI